MRYWHLLLQTCKPLSRDIQCISKDSDCSQAGLFVIDFFACFVNSCF
nr:MAG TPA: hypothetical protein [Caudoviricetes sp.]